MKFEVAAREAAEHIRRGSLVEDPEYSQVSAKAFDALASINDAGCLTFDSQEGGPGQRSYVTGFMKRSRAHEAVTGVNLAGRIAFSPVQVSKWPRNVPNIPVTLDPKDNAATWAPHFFTPGDIDCARAQVGLNKSEPVCVVHFIDPEWERSAHGAAGLFEVVRKSLCTKRKCR